MTAPKGLDIFREHFADFIDQYVLIGGTANYLAMGTAGVDARLTKDLDIVLMAEALTPAFGEAFWVFIEAGGYQVQQEGVVPRRFYRFSKPSEQGYPFMLELFSRIPDGLAYAPPRSLTPIPFDDSVASLSAILLDDDYYHLLHQGAIRLNGLAWVNEQVLIPLKMKAWLDLRQRKVNGENIDEKNIRKHFIDVLNLSRILSADASLALPESVLGDVKLFITEARQLDDNTRALGFSRGVTLESILAQLSQVFRATQSE